MNDKKDNNSPTGEGRSRQLYPRKPILFCFCGPSGSGKSTVTRELVKCDSTLLLSISTTTRSPRPGETDGIEYHFVSKTRFQELIKAGAFVEYAEYGGNFYGTSKQNIERAEAERKDLVFDIEVQGVERMKQLYADAVVTVFVFPPSRAELEIRLRGRKSESDEKIKERLLIADNEIERLRTPGFSQYLLITGSPKKTLERALQMIYAERYKFARQPVEFLAKILDRAPGVTP